jgi:SAM-dependent methyltransferase
MSVFGPYAKYYDLLYRDKRYDDEARFVESLLARYAPQGRRILELGCGTGAHAELLARGGCRVHGVDISEDMLAAAAERRARAAPEVRDRLSFSQGSAADCRADGPFDAVLSLFHVVSYHTGNDELQAMFANAARHLAPGGAFIFDYWYGPAVLTDRPAVRVKRMESDDVLVTRIAEPVMHPRENVVDVNYDVTIRDKADGTIESLREKHRMRYLFTPEVDALARQAGLRLRESCEWMTGREPGFDTWGVCSIVTK